MNWQPYYQFRDYLSEKEKNKIKKKIAIRILSRW